MHVIYTNEPVIGLVDGTAQVIRGGDVIFDNGIDELPAYPNAVEIPLSLFGDYPQMANNENTRRENGVWVFDFDVEAHEAEVELEQSVAVRTKRYRLLVDCDWTVLPDAPLNEQDSVQWQRYRQALRDVPQQAGFPHSVEWPEEPATKSEE